MGYANPKRKFCSVQCQRKGAFGQHSSKWKGGLPFQIYQRYKDGARKRKILFTLTQEEFLSFWGQPCHYCGVAISTIGLDRSENELGYLKGNVVPCCRVCNWMKRNYQIDEFLTHVETIRRHIGRPSNWIDKTAIVGNGTKIWHFAVVLQKVIIGEHCNIGSFAEIGRGSVIGDRVRISSGVFLPSDSRVCNDVFLGPHCTFADDKYPRANNPSYYAQPPVIEDYVSVGMGAIILPGVRLGKGCSIGAGAVVTKHVAPGTHVRGEPARLKTMPLIHHEEFHDLAVPVKPENFKKHETHLIPT